MKGIVLAGGTGSRLLPMTKTVSKQLLPVYDKPLIFYPISTLMLAGIRDILIITTPEDSKSFQELLGNGESLGISISYDIQEKPNGIAQALVIGEKFLDGDSCLLILGDNIFHGAGLGMELRNTFPTSGAHIYIYEVQNPTQYGILTLDQSGLPESIKEKPLQPSSNLAITGLYFFDSQASDIAKKVQPSSRNELEITSVLNAYLDNHDLTFTHLSRGVAWFDTGTVNSLHDAATYVRVIQERTGLNIACLEEVALLQQWLSLDDLEKNIRSMGLNVYSDYLRKLLVK
jgi:glucose-1-phosphate thymidylyltransferase